MPHGVRILSSIYAQFLILGTNNYLHTLNWCPRHATKSLLPSRIHSIRVLYDMNDHCGPEITLNFITFGFPKINYVLIVINYGYVYEGADTLLCGNCHNYNK